MKLRIEELCRQRGLRMSDIAAKMGVNQANLTSSLKGNPTISRLEAVANVLGVGIADLFAKPSASCNDVLGYLECTDGIHKVSSIADLLSAESSIIGMVNVPVYFDIQKLRKRVRDFIHDCIKKDEGAAFMAGRIDHREMFHLCWDSEPQKFMLTLSSKGEISQFDMLEYGDPDDGYDIDGPMGLIQMIINDLESSLESVEDSCDDD